MDSITNNFHISQEIYFRDTQLESPGRIELAIKSLIRKESSERSPQDLRTARHQRKGGQCPPYESEGVFLGTILTSRAGLYSFFLTSIKKIRNESLFFN